MLQRDSGVSEGIDAYRVVGTLTREDYERTVEPLVDEAARRGRPLRLLLQVGPEFEGFTAGALWGKTETWLEHPSLVRMIDGYALVSDVPWLREALHLMAFLLPFPARVFPNDERDEAVAWLCSLPGTPATAAANPTQGDRDGA